jgi:hypothetical protein
LKVSNGVDPTVTSKLPPVYTVGAATAVEHVALFATTFAWFVDAKPVPDTCTTHDAVIGQSKFYVSGPFNVNRPTLNEKSVLPLGLWLQESRYRTEEVPPVKLVPVVYT